jgi:hypothetical protein
MEINATLIKNKKGGIMELTNELIGEATVIIGSLLILLGGFSGIGIAIGKAIKKNTHEFNNRWVIILGLVLALLTTLGMLSILYDSSAILGYVMVTVGTTTAGVLLLVDVSTAFSKNVNENKDNYKETAEAFKSAVGIDVLEHNEQFKDIEDEIVDDNE